MKRMKRYMWVVLVVAFVVAALLAASQRFAAQSSAGKNGGKAIGAKFIEDITLEKASRGVVLFTAAINADGSVANCWGCDRSNTIHIDTGEYQVAFYQDVRATRGFWRWVQVDTLQIGSIDNVSCTTADRDGVPKAVWVDCFDNSTGAETDTSFFLFDAGRGLALP